jgi:hypothetical protein
MKRNVLDVFEELFINFHRGDWNKVIESIKETDPNEFISSLRAHLATKGYDKNEIEELVKRIEGIHAEIIADALSFSLMYFLHTGKDRINRTIF